MHLLGRAYHLGDMLVILHLRSQHDPSYCQLYPAQHHQRLSGCMQVQSQFQVLTNRFNVAHNELEQLLQKRDDAYLRLLNIHSGDAEPTPTASSLSNTSPRRSRFPRSDTESAYPPAAILRVFHS